VKQAKKKGVATQGKLDMVFDEDKAAFAKANKRAGDRKGYFKRSLGHFQPLAIASVYQFILSNEKKYPCQL
jgi:hypothetical protein